MDEKGATLKNEKKLSDIFINIQSKKRIYNSNSEFYKVLDDFILIKARYEDGNFNKKITDDYYAKIVDENGVPTIYKINDDRDIIY